MKIVDVVATNLAIPYPGEVRPAWQPGLVVTAHNFTLGHILTDEGLMGVGGTSGYAIRAQGHGGSIALAPSGPGDRANLGGS